MISDGWHLLIRPWRAATTDLSELVDALNALIAAQRNEIQTLRRLLLDEKRVSRDVARFADDLLDGCDDDLHETMHDIATFLSDRVALIEEHRE